MPSIILSFVGNQDPFAKGDSEGSIVSLIKHLIQQQQTIKRVILLHTDTTEVGAIDTQDWLTTTLNLLPEAIQLLPVDAALSQDPVNLLLAVQAARTGLEQAQMDLEPGDTLELNGSSGTPVMKSAWSILQAAGYAPRSHLWQVRNPHEMQSHQDHVFKTDFNALKDEFDLKVIQQQIQDYNYSGALISLKQSQLQNPVTIALLEYGYYCLSMDFNRAFSILAPFAANVDAIWLQDLAPLRQKDRRALLREAYFNALIKLKNQKYAEFLVMLSGLQENVLRFLINRRLNLQLSGKYSEATQAWKTIQQVDQGNLYRFLQAYKLPRGGSLRLDTAISRYVQIAILEYDSQFAALIRPIHELNDYCDQRNDAVHELVGISEINDQAKVLANLRKIITQVAGNVDTNPFDRLNQDLSDRLACR